MTAEDRDEWEKRNSLSAESIDAKPWRGLQIHSQNTPHHEFVKFCIAWMLDERGRAWDSEVTFPNGRQCDVLDLGPTDGKPLVYEVETDVTPKRAREKLEHFQYGPVRDVLVIDPGDVPTAFPDAIEYLDTHHVV